MEKKHKKDALKGINEELVTYNWLKNVKQSTMGNPEVDSPEVLKQRATGYLNTYMKHKTFELLRDAYESDSILAGKDYTSERGSVTLTESGIKKERKIADKAKKLTIKENEELMRRYNIRP